MPSFKGTLLREQLRLLKPIVRRATIQDSRFVQNKYGELGAKGNADKVYFEPVTFENYKAAWVRPQECESDDKAILYLHGGGYTAGHLEYALGFGSVLAAETGLSAFCVAYRLAPEYVFPAALEDAVHAYRYLLEAGFSPEHIALAGESAGGGLEFALCLRLRDLGLPMPGRIVALSPWTDLAMTGASYETNEEVDPSLVRESLAYYARLYARDDLQNPYVSPLYGKLEGMPPSMIIVGSDELLRDDSVRMAQRLKQSGSSCQLYIYDGMWHVFPVFSIPESKDALEKICNFLKDWQP